MSIIATAKVPGNGDMRLLDTFELPKVRTHHRKPEPATPCPPWCVEHSTGTPGFPADRTTSHEAPRTAVPSTFSSGPVGEAVERHTVEVWAERFDTDPQADGHPVVGYPAVHLGVDGYDSTGLSAEQAERIGRALLDSAAKVRVETTRLAGRQERASAAVDAPRGPVWPPKTCPSWCSYADDPGMHAEAYGPVHQDDRTHLHDHYRCVPGSDPNSDDPEPGFVELSLESPHRYRSGGNPKTVHQHLSAELSLHYREAEPGVRIVHMGESHGSPGSQFNMTLDEADQLAQLLAHLVELGREG